MKTLLPALLLLLSLGLAHADTALETSMKHMSKAYKELNVDLKAPQDSAKPDYLALAATLKTEGEKSRADVPKIAQGMTPDQQATMVAAYQKSVDTFLGSVDALTAALQASQWDEARKQMAILHREMVDGHKAFRKKE